ncbi:hypothetical protein PHMEG_0001959 [Phytophthora megakarya]|uniref:Uncharacterized protein n=1 Tax=Phytophthora megakarya TaxID=4795 RepID=A0A225WZR5_9STRA|nr:hypothetical protein PHMEG_0001959 [Phytophthora megakarya]
MAWWAFLCEKVRHTVDGAAMSCFDIWHKAWRNGTLLPKKASKRKIRARTPACREGTSEEQEEEVGNIQSSGDESTTGGPYLPKRTRQAPDAATTDPVKNGVRRVYFGFCIFSISRSITWSVGLIMHTGCPSCVCLAHDCRTRMYRF